MLHRMLEPTHKNANTVVAGPDQLAAVLISLGCLPKNSAMTRALAKA